MMRTILLVLVAMLVAGVTVFAGDDAPKAEKAATTAAVVDWNQLAKFLPEKIEGYEAGEVDGGTMNMANPSKPGESLSMSSVEREYEADGGKQSIEIMIVDGTMNPMIMAPYTMMQMEFDGPDGSMKTLDIHGHKAILNTEKEEGEVDEITLAVMIEDRLLLVFESDGAVAEADLMSLAEGIDYEGLVALLK